MAEAMGDVGSNPGVGNLILAVEATKTQMIEIDHTESVGRDKVTDVRGNYTLDSGRRIELTAGDTITIKVGASLVTLDDNGNIIVNGTRMAVTMDTRAEGLALSNATWAILNKNQQKIRVRSKAQLERYINSNPPLGQRSFPASDRSGGKRYDLDNYGCSPNFLV